MKQPSSLREQYQGKSCAELMRGSGTWPLQLHPVDLEPPYEPFDHRSLNQWDCCVNGWEQAFTTNFLGWSVRGEQIYADGDTIEIPHRHTDDLNQLRPITVEPFAEDESTIEKAEQFLRTIIRLRRPAAFEILGMGSQPQFRDNEHSRNGVSAADNGSTSLHKQEIMGWSAPYTLIRFIAHRRDAGPLAAQLTSQFANSAVTLHDGLTENDIRWPPPSDLGYGATLQLGSLHCFPLRYFGRLDPDPLGVILGAFDQLQRRDWALLQILFTPTRHDWASIAWQAAMDVHRRNEFIFNDLDERILRQKFSSPIFAVSIRVMARRDEVFSQLIGWSEQFSQHPQSFRLCAEESADTFPLAVTNRTTFRPGFLLNSSELASLIHVPAGEITSDRLRTIKTRTRPARHVTATANSVVLGDNHHRGQVQPAYLPDEMRRRHVYIAGQTGVGKTTLILNLVVQDIAAGRGVGVIDPHGDLIDDILVRIPKHRAKDVILFDPTDLDFPPAFNILQSHDDDERDKVVVETIATLQRFSHTPFGSRFEHILRSALTTLVQFRNSTLADVPRLLLDPAFRARVVGKIRVPELLDFWRHEFPSLPSGSCDPIMNRLSALLLRRRIRNVLCQREATLKFDEIINRRQIFLAKLSSGLLTDEGTAIFGTFIMAKFLAATFRRAAIPPSQRVPFQLFVDEFQNFAQTSIGFDKVLSEARKYGLVLAGLANQFVAQLSHEVRAAIIGNVGTMLSFRLGTTDARLFAGEFGVFSEQEILALERGQALARVGGTDSTFNLVTYPPPPVADEDMSSIIRNRSREIIARPRHEVEAQFQSAGAQMATAKSRPKRNSSSKHTPKPSKTKPLQVEATDDEWSAWSDYVS